MGLERASRQADDSPSALARNLIRQKKTGTDFGRRPFLFTVVECRTMPKKLLSPRSRIVEHLQFHGLALSERFEHWIPAILIDEYTLAHGQAH